MDMPIFIRKHREALWVNLTILLMLIGLFLFINEGHVFSVAARYTGNPVYKATEEEAAAALLCNVVWGTEYVGPMLDILDRYDAKATFFLGGEWAEQNPDLVRRMVEEGHQIANHGYAHKHHAGMSLDQNREEIQKAEAAIEEITGIKTDLFAPPYGEFDKNTLQVAAGMGYTTVMWSVDTIDWRGDGVDAILKRVLDKAGPGDFILMHPTEDTIKALPIIIERLSEQNIRFATVGELIDNSE
jgi:peptidoglycan/xylan/chitin deacetylase (PgdA/CDA1 family)